jgi:preprotein translocase subunit YajC
MSPALSKIWLLAQAATEAAADAGAAPAGGAAGGGAKAGPAPMSLADLMPWMLGTFFIAYFLFIRPQKNREAQFRSMVDNLKEKDRVVTIGGIHGVVTNVQRDAGIITIRVDESTGTKIRVGSSAIAKVVTEETEAEAAKTP